MGFVQLFITLFIHARFSLHKPKDSNLSAENFPPVSIVIATRNEADNLYHNLPLLLTQDYPNFEVILVNHQSIDESSFLISAYMREFPNLRTIDIERSAHLKTGKKFPLTLGIKAAKYEHLLLTDADCKPASDQWLKSMILGFNPQKEIVIGYGPYLHAKGLLNRWIRFETAWIAANYFSFALAKIPYMGVGRNMAYKKETFNRVGGFKKHYSLPSGDDDLFIQATAKNNNTDIVINPNSFMYSKAKNTWSDYIRQKSRHLSATMYYKVIKKWLLGIYPLSMLGMLISFVFLLRNNEYWFLATCVFSLVTIIKWIVQGINFKKLDSKSFVWALPVLDVVYVLMSTIIYYSIDKKAVKKWK